MPHPAGRAEQQPAIAEILSIGMVTPLGFCAPQTAAVYRAGVARLEESHVHDRFVEPIVMGLVKDEELPPLIDPLEDAKLPPQRRRLLRMAAAAMAEALADVLDPVPLLLGTPEAAPGGALMVDAAFLQQVVMQSQGNVDLARSRLLSEGRASGLLAVEQAVRLLAARGAPLVLAGGVDSYLDEGVLAALDKDQRLRNGDVQDGFVPGEAAAFVLLGLPGAGARVGLKPLARILGIGLGKETGHIHSTTPYRGEGLAQAFQALFATVKQPDKVRTIYAGMNGESFWAKELGVACIRNRQRLEEPLRIEHPADGLGDAGAALGPLMVGLAAQGLQGGYRRGPCLVYCGSDREQRVAVLLAS